MESPGVDTPSRMGYSFSSPVAPVVVTVPFSFLPSAMVHWMLSSKPREHSFAEDTPATSRTNVAGFRWM
jgi:hypothetical protein